MESDNDTNERVEHEPSTNPVSSLGEIIMFTDHIPTKAEILEAKKQQLREKGMIK